MIWSSEAENIRTSAAVFREKAMGLKLHPCEQHQETKIWCDRILKKGEKELSTFPG